MNRNKQLFDTAKLFDSASTLFVEQLKTSEKMIEGLPDEMKAKFKPLLNMVKSGIKDKNINLLQQVMKQASELASNKS